MRSGRGARTTRTGTAPATWPGRPTAASAARSPAADDDGIREMLERTATRRRLEYPDAVHYVFFGAGRRVSRLA
jgi:hypothetical protein